MSEDPIAIAKEAKALQQGLKDLLKNRDPWIKEVEFQRKNLQKQYLLLLLSHPNAKESKDAETHMWMQTSYALISIYKSRIATLEHALREAGTQRQQPRSQRPGPVEYRKLMQRFKQFLSTEEKFWTHLVVRIQRQFALTEARSALATLSIVADTEPDIDDPDAGKHDHFRFPPEPVENAPPQPLTPAQRNSRRATLSKALVVLGDLARYREQYSEGASRTRGGPERGGRAARGRGSQADLPRAKNYDKARACYECARDLMPDDGNASHQLAILASYQKDTFESLVQYYKALCVRSAYDPAAENMGNVLSKFLDTWKRRRKGKQGGRAPSEDVTRSKTNPPSFKDNVILLHALWRLGVEMDHIAPKHDESVVKEFSELVSNRALPIDAITKVVIAAQGALWKQRKVSTPANAFMESRIASHVLALHRVLLQNGITELDEAVKIVEEDLAMRITATFRRTLPALRIASKWLRVNLEYVLGNTPKDPAGSIIISDLSAFWEAYTSFATRIVLVFPPTSLPKLKGPLEEDVDSRGYLPLGGMLAHDTIAVGSEGEDSRTPEQVHPNEEQLMRIWDIGRDARLIAESLGTPMESFRAQFSLIDSVRAGEQVSAQGVTSIGGDGIALTIAGTLSAADDRQSEEEDARTETTDPVGDVFREVLGLSSSEDEEDEIVWNPRSISPPTVTPVLSNKSTPHGRAGGLSPLSPLSPTRPNIGLGSTSPPRVPEAFASPIQPPNNSLAGQTSCTPKTTAQDLLNNVMGVGRPAHKADAKSAFPPHFTHQQSFSSPIRHHQRLSSSSQSQTLFSGAAGPSIWSAAPDESALGLSPLHKANAALPASPLMGLAPVGHAGLQTAVASISSAPQANVHSATTQNSIPPPTSSVQGLWPPYDHTKDTLPAPVTHMTPTTTFHASVERGHRHMPRSSIGSTDVFPDPGYQGSVVYASSPRQAPLPSNASGAYSAQETLSTAFNNSMALSSTIGSPLYQSMTTFGSDEYPMSHGAHASFGLPKYGGVRQQRAGGVWGDAG